MSPTRSARFATLAGFVYALTACVAGRTPASSADAGRATTPSVAPARVAATYDLVLLGGRVMDPESGLDAVRNVGIRDGRIEVVTEESIAGASAIDVHGLVVAPGFIDLHQHGFAPEALAARLRDGVTAVFEMELGTPDVDEWYDALAGKSPIHFGTAVGHVPLRMAVLTGTAWTGAPPTGESATRAATAEEIARIRARVEDGLRRGALGVGLGIAYTPGATPWEVVEMFRAAGAFPGAPVHVHVRETETPQHWMEVAELFLGSIISGAPLHIVHANSSFGRDAPLLFDMIDSARARGMDITTETYPWTAAMTAIDAAPFDDWESWADERFHRFEWPATGERLTRESFGRYRARGGVVVIHGMDEARLRPTLTSRLTMIVSDGVYVEGAAHPRIAGSNARVLGRYVRDEGLLTLMEALRKMTLLPARRLEERAPAMRSKGRLRAGADADITVFDPATVADRATYAEPLLPSAGIRFVLVNGTMVVRDGDLVAGVAPGRAVRAAVQRE